jgi:hypothetical protein
MNNLSECKNALLDVAGLRRYLIVGVIAVGVGLIGWIPILTANIGMTFLGVPTWAAALIVFLAVTWYWMLKYIVEMHRLVKGARSKIVQMPSILWKMD